MAFPAVRFQCRYGKATQALPICIEGGCSSTGRSWSFQARLDGCWQGEVATDRGKMMVLLDDEGCRARYNRRFTEAALDPDGPGLVTLFLDRTLTGEIVDGGKQEDQVQVLNEVQSFCGRLYRFTPSTTGDRLRIEELPEAPGMLLPLGHTSRGAPLLFHSLLVAGKPGFFAVTGASVQLPAGEYELLAAGAQLHGEAETASYLFGGPGRLRAAPGRTTWLGLGGALKLRIRLLAPGEVFDDFRPWRTAGKPSPGPLVLRRGQEARLVSEVVESHGYHVQRFDRGFECAFILRNTQGKAALSGRLPADAEGRSGLVRVPANLPPGQYTLEASADTGSYQGKVTARQPVLVR